MNGGYVMIKSSDSEIYSKVKKAIEIGKPILYYENDTTCYYIDSASIVGTDVILTKGGKTITIDNDNNVVSSGDIQNHLYNYHFYISYDNSDEVTCYLSVEFTSNKNVDLNRNGLIELLDGKLKGVFSALNNNTDLSDSNKTLLYELGYESNDEEFYMKTIDDEANIIENDDFTNFEIKDTSYRIQLF